MSKGAYWYPNDRATIRVRIVPTPVGKYDCHTVIWRDGAGIRRRALKNTQALAEEKAEEIIKGIQSGAKIEVSQAVAAEYKEAALKLNGRPLLVAINELLAAESLLAGVSVIEAAKHYAERNKGLPQKLVKDAVAEFLQAKEEDGASFEYHRTLRGHLTRFKACFDHSLLSVTKPALEKWCRSEAPKMRTRKNLKGSLATFFGFCKEAGYLPETWSELKPVKRKDVSSAAPHCYSPEDFKKVLRFLQSENKRALICYFIMRGMLGVRHAEVFRINVRQFIDGHLVIEKEQSKVGLRRVVPLHGTSAQWLAEYLPKYGPAVPLKQTGTLTRTIARAYRKAEVKSHHNALRDSFISHRMAQCKDAARVSDEAGNSPSEIHTKYRTLFLATGEIITEAIAEKWFSIPVHDKP
jgi:integrase